MKDYNQRVCEYNNRVSTKLVKEGRLGELLAGLGLDLPFRPGRTLYQSSCPFHGGGGGEFFLRTNGHTVPIVWSCRRRCDKLYRCSLVGLVRKLLARQEGGDVGLGEAIDHVQAFYGVSLRQAKTRAEVRSRLEFPSAYMVSRGFSPAVLDQMDIGHYAVLGKTAVPVYDEDDQTVLGFIFRSELPGCEQCGDCHTGTDCKFGQAKWQFTKGFPRRTTVYNYARAAQSDSLVVLLVEGVGDVLKAMAAGYPAVATFGIGVEPEQADKLAALGKRIAIAFDNDPSGRGSAPKVKQDLATRGAEVDVVHPPERFKDLGEMPEAEIVRWFETEVLFPG